VFCLPPDGTMVARSSQFNRKEARMMSACSLDCVADLRSLIRAEYREMPGLNLTLPQAIRLWTAEPALCSQVLEALVDTGFLRRAGATYVRADGGRRCA
jgi:hypothetical protein